LADRLAFAVRGGTALRRALKLPVPGTSPPRGENPAQPGSRRTATGRGWTRSSRARWTRGHADTREVRMPRTPRRTRRAEPRASRHTARHARCSPPTPARSTRCGGRRKTRPGTSVSWRRAA